MEKSVVYIILSVGITIGSYVPVAFGASIFSMWSIFGSFVGFVFAIIVVTKINNA